MAVLGNRRRLVAGLSIRSSCAAASLALGIASEMLVMFTYHHAGRLPAL